MQIRASLLNRVRPLDLSWETQVELPLFFPLKQIADHRAHPTWFTYMGTGEDASTEREKEGWACKASLPGLHHHIAACFLTVAIVQKRSGRESLPESPTLCWWQGKARKVLTRHRKGSVILTLATWLTNAMWPNPYVRLVRRAVISPLGRGWWGKGGN